MSGKKKIGVYIHIPFCEKKCRYCAFVSFAGYEERAYNDYVMALVKEIENISDGFAANYEVDSIFIGGGTPSLISSGGIDHIIRSLKSKFEVSDAEITIEANPNSLTKEKLMTYRCAGVNRLSIGAQSFSDDILDSLGRIHKSHDIHAAFADARTAGFENINIDLMFAVPGQSLDDLTYSVEQAIRLEPEHISLYGLQLEEETIFYEEYKTGFLDVPDEKEEQEMYYTAFKMIKDAGYDHYEISNAAKRGRCCLHNLKYWNLENYVGFGAAAHSYIWGERSRNVTSPDEYIRLLDLGDSPRDHKADYIDTPKEAMGIFIFTGLRRLEGIDLDEFEARFGNDLFAVFKDRSNEIKKYMDEGWLVLSGRRLYLSEAGIYHSNDIMAEFV